MSEKTNAKPYTRKEFLRFLIPSIIGLFLFIIPLPYRGDLSFSLKEL